MFYRCDYQLFENQKQQPKQQLTTIIPYILIHFKRPTLASKARKYKTEQHGKFLDTVGIDTARIGIYICKIDSVVLFGRCCIFLPQNDQNSQRVLVQKTG